MLYINGVKHLHALEDNHDPDTWYTVCVHVGTGTEYRFDCDRTAIYPSGRLQRSDAKDGVGPFLSARRCGAKTGARARDVERSDHFAINYSSFDPKTNVPLQLAPLLSKCTLLSAPDELRTHVVWRTHVLDDPC